jgi:hypothetical protein
LPPFWLLQRAEVDFFCWRWDHFLKQRTIRPHFLICFALLALLDQEARQDRVGVSGPRRGEPSRAHIYWTLPTLLLDAGNENTYQYFTVFRAIPHLFFVAG